MVGSSYTTLSDVIETFDIEETRRLLDAQLESLHDDACEGMIDNFKVLYQRYASMRANPHASEPETFEEVQNLFFSICEMYIKHITEAFDMSIDEEYLADHDAEIASIALQFYLFFVLDLRSNLFNVMLTFIGRNTELIASQFESMRQRKDSITEVNRIMDDQNVALIASNIYDVLDWVMAEMDADTFFDCMEDGYIALAPMKKMYQENVIDGGFIDALRDIMRENISMKARIGFDIICRLKGYDLNS